MAFIETNEVSIRQHLGDQKDWCVHFSHEKMESHLAEVAASDHRGHKKPNRN